MKNNYSIVVAFDWEQEQKKGYEHLSWVYSVESKKRNWVKYMEGKWIVMYYMDQYIRFIIAYDEQAALTQWFRVHYDNCDTKRMSKYYFYREIK